MQMHIFTHIMKFTETVLIKKPRNRLNYAIIFLLTEANMYFSMENVRRFHMFMYSQKKKLLKI